MKIKKLPFSAVLLAGTFMAAPLSAAYELTIADLGTSENIKWTEVTSAGDDTIKVDLGEGNVKYFHYEYIGNETGRTVYDTQQENLSGNVNADFVGSAAETPGGGLYNAENELGNITGDFINNTSAGQGGGLNSRDNAVVGNITGDFVGNKAQRYGGGIYNNVKSTIGDIRGNFVGNYVEGTNAAGGGLYSNKYDAGQTIKSISGNFIANHLEQLGATGGYAKGAGIDLFTSDVGSISGKFINNTINAAKTGYGSAINIGNSIVGSISGNFINNQTISQGFTGGAIYIYTNPTDEGEEEHPSIIKTISGDFINNGAISERDSKGKLGAIGGAIQNVATIKNIAADFKENFAYQEKGVSAASAGAIFNAGVIGDFDADGNYVSGGISGSFVGNHASHKQASATSGAIENRGKIGVITAKFTDNYAKGGILARGGAIFNSGAIKSIKNSIFEGNYVSGKDKQSSGGAIFNSGTIEEFSNVSFVDNSMKADSYNSLGGALASNGTIGKMEDVVFQNNSVSVDVEYARGGAIFIQGTVGSMKGLTFKGNYAKGGTFAMGGAIYNQRGLPDIVNSEFSGNYVEGLNDPDGKTAGGAIYSKKDLTIAAEDGTTSFKENYVKTGGKITGNDIYMAGTEDAAVNLNLKADNGTISFASGIDGKHYNINISGNGTVALDAAVKNADITNGSEVMSRSAGQIVTNVGNAEYLNGNNSLTVKSGEVNIAELNNDLHFTKLHMQGGALNIDKVGVDLAERKMGSVTADVYSNVGGEIDVKSVDVKTDGGAGTTVVGFTDSLIADKVVNKVTEAMGPVWAYDVNYNKENGNFEFTRGENTNPEVSAPIISAAATVAVLNDEIYSRVLSGPEVRRGDKLAISSQRALKNGWVKSFGSKDDVEFKNYEGADTKFYGLIGGLSTDRVDEGNGWSSIFSVYGAYAGGTQKFSNEKVTNNGGYLGIGANLYKENFYVATTLNAGMMRNRSRTRKIAGKETFNSYAGGIGAKAGCVYEAGDYEIEPGVYGSYTYVTAEDYETKSGAKVKFGSMNVMEAAPELKISRNFGNGVRGYVSSRYVWTFTEGSKVKANNFKLEEAELKDYAEYGIGIEKMSAESAGYLEITRRDGGREGWNAVAGFKKSF